jgi:hypothetical protein
MVTVNAAPPGLVILLRIDRWLAQWCVHWLVWKALKKESR